MLIMPIRETHMATLKDAVEQAIMELIDDGKLVIKGPDGQEMDDMSIEMKAVSDDDYDLDDSDDDSDSEEDEEDEE
ncbi:MAG: hypothetical protein VW948_01715 [Burkholderiaceae bacterium]